MRVSVVAGLIVAVHVAVIGSVIMTQGCTSTQSGAGSTTPTVVDSAPPPPMPPTITTVTPVAQPVPFPALQPPTQPEPAKTSVAAENVYVVKSGDSLSKIAVAHGVSQRELAELNKIKDANKIIVGQKLILPDHSKPSQSQPTAKSAATKTKSAAKEAAASGDSYVVKSGDALSKIAVAHGVKLKDLMAANNITDANKIRAGQKLTIPGAKKDAKAEGEKKEDAESAEPAKKESAKKKAEKADKAEKAEKAEKSEEPAAVEKEPKKDVPPVADSQDSALEYQLQPGDDVEGIARLFVVDIDDLRQINNLQPGQEVKPGQVLKIPPTR
jgi:LysM repeat protein